MKRVRLKLYSYHTFLVVPFIVLFLYGHNLDQARFAMTWRTLLIGLAGTGLFFALFYPVFRNRLKTGVYTTLDERHPAATVVAPPRADAVLGATADSEPTQRDRHIQGIAGKGRMAWQERSPPGQRWRQKPKPK